MASQDSHQPETPKKRNSGFEVGPPQDTAVSIAETESTSPPMQGTSKDVEDSNVEARTPTPKQYRAHVGGTGRVSARPSLEHLHSSQRSGLVASPHMLAQDEANPASRPSPAPHSRSHTGGGDHGFLTQVASWLKAEKARRAASRKPKADTDAIAAGAESEKLKDGGVSLTESQGRRASDASEGSVALESLQQLIDKALSHSARRPSASSRKLALLKNPRRHSTAGSSDTDYVDGDVRVPSCDAVLDNSKTLDYFGGAVEGSDKPQTPGLAKGKDAWNIFKYEIVRLAHTLRLKGWRRVPMDMSSEIEVERLSGALTNAVYVVSPPKNLPNPVPKEGEEGIPLPKNAPPKLLLRIYGPQAEHLIDREEELQILQRLARKRIGPRLLGTFTNGRFEEFFHAQTLTPKDLRNPDTSKQIAKRMRELHDGVHLLEREREKGPFVWQNWDKWVARCDQVISWFDGRVKSYSEVENPNQKEALWKSRGLVCGVEWQLFRRTVEKYRCWLEEQYGGLHKVKEHMIFSHNDTQYGNILRLIPAGESPLLLPANEHKQLIVIDFEYANANPRGLEFANHFTEWCYNYHDPTTPHSCNTAAYPTPEEQTRFIRSYVRHRPFHSADSMPPTPALSAIDRSLSSISTFMLDSRYPATPGAGNYQNRDLMAVAAAEDEVVDEEVKRLRRETLLWRAACSAHWVAWGIVQAKVPDSFDTHGTVSGVQSTAKDTTPTATPTVSAAAPPQLPDAGPLGPAQATDPLEKEEQAMARDLADKRPDDGEEEEEDFDYFGYSHERALFFWGDMIRLGIVKADELPKELLAKVRTVDY